MGNEVNLAALVCAFALGFAVAGQVATAIYRRWIRQTMAQLDEYAAAVEQHHESLRRLYETIDPWREP